MKRCTCCGETKPLTEFSPQKKCRLGVKPDCKMCRRAKEAARRQANLEDMRARDRARYANSTKRREESKARARAHYWNNREAHIACKRQYYLANPEVYERARQKRNALERGAEHQPYSRREIYERDGGRCRGCHRELEYKPWGFEIDHIVPIALGGPDIPANVQLMCFPCNRSKWVTLEGQIHLPV